MTEALRAEVDDSFVLVNGLVLKGQSGDIDHVLIGPTGVFVIETKNYSGYIRCEGDTWVRKPSRSARRYREISLRSPARAVLQDAEAVRRALPTPNSAIPITPLVVFTNPDLILSVKRPLAQILRLDELLYAVKAPQASLTTSDVDSIVGLLIKKKPQNEKATTMESP